MTPTQPEVEKPATTPDPYAGNAGCLRAAAESMMWMTLSSLFRFLPIYYGWRWFVAPLAKSLELSAGRLYGLAWMITLLVKGLGTVEDYDKVKREIETRNAQPNAASKNLKDARRNTLKVAGMAVFSLIGMYVIHRLIGTSP